MRILIDIQTLFTDEKKRGIGIYTYHWLETLTCQSVNDRFYLMKKKENKWYFCFISKFVDFDVRLIDERYWFEQDLEEFIIRKAIDIVHFTSPYMFDVDIPNIKNSKVKKSYLVYDLIPLALERDYYLKWPKNVQSLYDERSQKLKEADLILTISETSKQDLIKFLKIESKKINVIYASTNEILFNPKEKSKQKELLEDELGITTPFIYSLTGYDPRKNNKGLISAFSNLSRNHSNLKLVIGGIKQPIEQKEFIDFAISKGLSTDRLLLLGYVSEESLVALYQECEMFVFPSLYEGFGLPVLEAMRCGAPVITSNCSSLPEIVGQSAILVDPRSEQAIESAMENLLSDSVMRDKLIAQGYQQSRDFSWDFVVSKSLLNFKELVYGIINTKEDNINKPKLAYLSPFNPQTSGISDYSEELLFFLKNYYEITIFVNDYTPNNKFISETFEIIDISVHQGALEHFEKRLYHVGNNEYHKWIIEALEKYPGYIVLHDYNLFGFFMYTTYLKGNTDAFVHELIYNSGAEGEAAARSLLNSNTIPESQQFPLSNRVVDLSNGVIVHSNWVKKSILLNNSYNGVIEVIPHGFTLEPLEDEDTTKPRKLKNTNEFTIGVFGNVIPNKRIDVVIKTVSRLLETNEEVHLYIIGHAEESYKKELLKLVDDLKLKRKVTFIDSPDIDSFKTHIKESDLCINLRWPSMGETSGTLMRSLGYGIPCIVSNTGSYMEYPDECVWKVDIDGYEEELLLAYLIELCNNPRLRNEMSSNATRYVKEKCDFSITAGLYENFINFS
ncbi:glycosyltransferase [Paenibacillus sp. 19GGS1-52]|uniref:glycosyltransferase n=1 Tax=Paenibacillus sp. 19GGS1-52 TaxID=2758563 RepID=UPI001EFA9F92|nr:glycosyltransferase [Paenibacillus sp. 19GGS1-52]ULO08039.1 glycosyltransferase [Paenibacillus sp. 19GGS1-52]